MTIDATPRVYSFCPTLCVTPGWEVGAHITHAQLLTCAAGPEHSLDEVEVRGVVIQLNPEIERHELVALIRHAADTLEAAGWGSKLAAMFSRCQSMHSWVPDEKSDARQRRASLIGASVLNTCMNQHLYAVCLADL